MAEMTFPDFTGTIKNFSFPQTCGGTLVQIMTVSCNTAFMQMGRDLKLPALSAGAQEFGWLKDVPIDLPGAIKSNIPTPEGERIGEAGVAQTSIGQQNNAATPLQIALVAAAAANNGVIMKPHVLANIRNADGTVVNEFRPEEWLRPLSPDNAAKLRTALLGPVNNAGGSASGRIRLPAGMQAGGKTGTAQTGGSGAPVHTWFMGFAGPAGNPPMVAVSVVVLRQNNNGEATGGQVAAPIANTILNKALEVADKKPIDNTALFLTKPTVPPAPGETTTTTTR
jgi:peptidoglycan glycosyltransferase